MQPTKWPHLFVACLLVFCGVCMFAVGIVSTTDFCVEISGESAITNYFSRASNSPTNIPAKATVFLLSTGILTIAVIPWFRYKEYPDYQNFLKEVQRKRTAGCTINYITSYYALLFKIDFLNLVIYATLFALFSFLLVIYIRKPNNFMLADPSPIDSDNVNLECYSGLGAFTWFENILILICVGFFSLMVICMINIYKEHKELKFCKRDLRREGFDRRITELNANSLLPQNHSVNIELQSIN